MRKLAVLALMLATFVSGCATSSVTNLSTTRQPRNATGMYPIEFVWDSNQTSIIPESIKPYVVIGYDSYPMRPSLKIKDRWETVIPVAANKNSVIYHFKVDYEYKAIGKPQKSSKLTPSYKLEIADK